jgi:hypothetical protein
MKCPLIETCSASVTQREFKVYCMDKFKTEKFEDCYYYDKSLLEPKTKHPKEWSVGKGKTE